MQKYHTLAKFLPRTCHTSPHVSICRPKEARAQGALMFDFARKATDYQWQALKHEEQALRARDANLKKGFAALAQMCQARATQMERQAQVMKARGSV
jgi:hypothetical protein